jgi:hypothetical protein
MNNKSLEYMLDSASLDAESTTLRSKPHQYSGDCQMTCPDTMTPTPVPIICDSIPIGCIRDSEDTPDWQPKPDQLPIAVERDGNRITAIWMYTCENGWARTYKLTDLEELEADTIGNPCENVQIHLTVSTPDGNQTVGITPLSTIVNWIKECSPDEFTVKRIEADTIELIVNNVPQQIKVAGCLTIKETESGTPIIECTPEIYSCVQTINTPPAPSYENPDGSPFVLACGNELYVKTCDNGWVKIITQQWNLPVLTTDQANDLDCNDVEIPIAINLHDPTNPDNKSNALMTLEQLWIKGEECYGGGSPNNILDVIGSDEACDVLQPCINANVNPKINGLRNEVPDITIDTLETPPACDALQPCINANVDPKIQFLSDKLNDIINVVVGNLGQDRPTWLITAQTHPMSGSFTITTNGLYQIEVMGGGGAGGWLYRYGNVNDPIQPLSFGAAAGGSSGVLRTYVKRLLTTNTITYLLGAGAATNLSDLNSIESEIGGTSRFTVNGVMYTSPGGRSGQQGTYPLGPGQTYIVLASHGVFNETSVIGGSAHLEAWANKDNVLGNPLFPTYISSGYGGSTVFGNGANGVMRAIDHASIGAYPGLAGSTAGLQGGGGGAGAMFIGLDTTLPNPNTPVVVLGGNGAPGVIKLTLLVADI